MVCRAMANFGVSDLRLVNPCSHLHPDAHKFAVFANDLLGSAKVFDDLPSAIADLHLTIAATRRAGKLRGSLRDVREAPSILEGLSAGCRAGIVFGREDAGLTSEEVSLCSCSAMIPTDPVRGSLNLSQAVLIFLYEFCRGMGSSEPNERDIPSQGEMEELFEQMERILDRIAFLNAASPESGMYPLRRFFQRAAPDRRELALLKSLWTQVDWSVRDWKGRKRGENPPKSD